MSWGIEVEIFGSLMMFVLGVFVSLFSLVNVLLICCFLVKCLGKLVRIWLVNEILCVFMLMFDEVVNDWIIGSNEYVVSVGVLLVMV